MTTFQVRDIIGKLRFEKYRSRKGNTETKYRLMADKGAFTTSVPGYMIFLMS